MSEQQNQIASTDRPIQFRRGAISGSSVGANLNAKAHTLVLNSAAHLVSAVTDPKKKKKYTNARNSSFRIRNRRSKS